MIFIGKYQVPNTYSAALISLKQDYNLGTTHAKLQLESENITGIIQIRICAKSS